MHELVKRNYQSILLSLSWMEVCDAEGWTPLASAAINNNGDLCEFLVESGCTIFLGTNQKERLKPKLLNRIHDAARDGHETALQLLLDMGADINERNSVGKTALLEAIYYNLISCVKILIQRGADATISSHNRTALHCAVFACNEQIMKFLLDSAVETRRLVDAEDSSGDIAIHNCAYVGSATAVAKSEMLL